MNLNMKKLAALFVAATVLITGCSEKVAPPATNQPVQRVEAAKLQQQLFTHNQDLTNAQRRRDALNKPASELLASAERCWSTDLVRRNRR